MTSILVLSAAGFWDSFQHAVNWLTQPSLFVTLATIVVVLLIVAYKTSTKPAIAALLLFLFCAFYFGSMANKDYRTTVTKPDNVPITIMVISLIICIWISFRRPARHPAT